MSENPFLEALQNSVGRTRAAFVAADKDLHEAISEASNALQEFTKGQMRLALDPRSDTARGRLYDIDLIGRDDVLVRTVASLRVGQSGYPIAYGSQTSEKFTIVGRLPDKSELNQYLIGLMSDQDSPLTVSVAFLLREAEQAAGEESSNSEE